MTDSKSTDDNKSAKEKSSTTVSSTGGKTVNSSNASKKESAAKPEAKTAGAAKAKPAKTLDANATATIEKAGASKDSEMKSAARKLNEPGTKTADKTVNSKKGIDELKDRAHEARQRAQQKILEKSYVSDKPTDPLERLANTFDSSAKRWEMVVYPSLFAFVLLAGYGFFLIYRLTHDISTLSQSVTRMAVIVSDSMPKMTKDLKEMTSSMDNMTIDIAGMTTEIVSMSAQMTSLTPMSQNIQSMTHNIGNMNRSVYGLSRDMHGMNRTVSSGPFGMMNDVMPFTSDTNVPPPMPPQPVWPSFDPNSPAYQGYAPRPASNEGQPVSPSAQESGASEPPPVPYK